jgi:dTMP kinase
MQELLDAGTTTVVDRYSHSGVAFPAAKDGMDVEWRYAPEKGLPARPDAILYLGLPIEKAMKRGEFGAERYEKEEFQKKVRENFFQMMKEGPQELWNVMDADQTIEELEVQIPQEVAKKVISEVKDKPIGFL